MRVLIMPPGGSVRKVLNIFNRRHVLEVIIGGGLNLGLSDFVFQKGSVVVLKVQMQILWVEAPTAVGLRVLHLPPIIILIAVVLIILWVMVIAEAGLA
jgi:hypothetical protein